MHSASRRAFLTGRRVQKSPWETFLSKLRRLVEGKVQDLKTDNGAARLIPAAMQDVYRARTLCVEFGITMALDGIQHSSRLDDGPLLWVEPGLEMARFNRLGPEDSRWFVQPGCLIGDLEAAGLPQFKDQPPHLTVAAWLADRQTCDWDYGATNNSGVVHALVMLADGTQANLGAFGVNNKKPLGNLRVQNMIPQLFELANSANLDTLQQDNFFNGKYRLDALKPVQAVDINLAHLLLGHGGELGWLEWVVLDAAGAAPIERAYDVRYGNREQTIKSEHSTDVAIKNLFDPDGLFPAQGQKL